VYWLLARETGWTYPEIDALLVTDFNEIAEQWGAQAAPDGVQVAAPAAPREVTEEEWKRICAAEQGFAEKHGGPRNPFL
jgi:hypothetical protein